MLLNCDRMEDGRVSILEEKPLLFMYQIAKRRKKDH
ncbi:unnamed protein product [Brugia pahangi]|uniref:Uncharacterized protein n=1 Tax=Brugia pahangi TaxID=6280 RepID=A0A0N4THY4_BRUPA|nr:unnamed protein product [Brugia pahangi]